MSQFLMPSLGADMESAILMEWHVKEGDSVTKGQVIAEVETSKGVIEIEVFEDGVVEKILVEEETECKVGTPLALIRSSNEEQEEEEEPIKEKVEQKEKKEEIVEKQEAQIPAEQKPEAEAAQPTTQERIKISPAARKKAEELGVDLASFASKADETIELKDILQSVEKEKKPESKTAKEQSVPKGSGDGMRQAIAAAMSRSNAEIPHYYLSASINMSPALEWLGALNSKRSINERILPTALLIRAVVKALGEVPELNGFYKDGSNQISEAINPGIAIALRKGGLITPALLDAHEMTLDETMKALSELITRTRAGKLRGSEMTKQTITVTNLGDLGVESVYGVIYPPQVAIVGLGRIADSPWAEGDTLAVRKVMQATLSGDHRATDGRTGALFLSKLEQFLQKPEELL